MPMNLYLSHPFNDKHHSVSDWQNTETLQTILKLGTQINDLNQNQHEHNNPSSLLGRWRFESFKYSRLNVEPFLKKIGKVEPFEIDKKSTVAEKRKEYAIDKSRPLQQRNNLKKYFDKNVNVKKPTNVLSLFESLLCAKNLTGIAFC